MTATATFTDPKTWAFQEGVESAELNTNIRDEINSMGPHLLVRKTSDQTNSTTTFVNDTQLVVPVGASDVWQFNLLVSVASNDNWKFGFTLPASGQIKGFSTESGGIRIFESGSQPQITCVTWQSGLGCTFRIEGVYTGGGTAGNVQLQWGCLTNVSCVVKANSTWWGVRLV